jgi:hypothetical protein
MGENSYYRNMDDKNRQVSTLEPGNINVIMKTCFEKNNKKLEIC